MTPTFTQTKLIDGIACKVRPNDKYGLSMRHVMTKRPTMKRQNVICVGRAKYGSLKDAIGKMKQGERVLLPHKRAESMAGTARKMGIAMSMQGVGNDYAYVWRVSP